MNHGSSFLTVGFITLEDIQNSTLIMLSYFFPTLFLLCSFSDSVRTDKERKRISEVFAELYSVKIISCSAGRSCSKLLQQLLETWPVLFLHQRWKKVKSKILLLIQQFHVQFLPNQISQTLSFIFLYPAILQAFHRGNYQLWETVDGLTNHSTALMFKGTLGGFPVDDGKLSRRGLPN